MSTAQSPSQTIGPMYGFALYESGMEHAVDPGTPGAVTIEGFLLDGDGEPIAYPDAMIEVWQGEQFARSRTDPFGTWRVHVRKPTAAEMPRLPDGEPQAPHLNVTIWARGLMKQAVTRVYFPDEGDANAADPVLALVDPQRRFLLVGQEQAAGVLRFDIHVQGEHEAVFFDF